MCTASWIRDDSGYELFFNRDEKRTRKPATPPALTTSNGISYLAPIDGDFGGTWIATNQAGLTLCLLNGVSREGTTALRSRGLLIPELVTEDSVDSVCERIESTDLSVYAPFTLGLVDRESLPAVVEWDGHNRSITRPSDRHYMLTSSSFNSGDVRRWRREAYLLLEPSLDTLAQFHHSHENGPSAYSICMHRPDAETVSFSRVRVDDRTARFEYAAGSPCRNEPSQDRQLLIVHR